MKKFKYLFIVLLVSLLFSSCLEEMELDETLLTPKIAVSTFLNPNNSIYIKLMHDIPVNQENNGWNGVPDANVTLYEDGKKVTELKKLPYYDYSYNNYGEKPIILDTSYHYMAADKYPQPGKTYQLEVESETYGSIRTETTVPFPVQINKVESVVEEKQTDNYRYNQLNFKVRFTDPADEENYYRILLHKIEGKLDNWKDSTDQTIYINNTQSGLKLYTEDNIFFYEKENANSFVVGETDNNYGIFTDETINGKEYELKFSITMNPVELDTTVGEFFAYRIELQSITKDMYYYLKSIDQQEIMYQFPFSEPIPVYSNVENGIGVLGSYSSSAYPVFYGQYPKDGVVYDTEYEFYNE